MNDNIDSVTPRSVSQSVPEQKRTTFDFYTALRHIFEGKKVSKIEWANLVGTYGFLKDELLMININGVLHQWVISKADMEGTDYCDV